MEFMEYQACFPELILLFFGCLILLVESFSPNGIRARPFYLSVLAIFLCMLFTVCTLHAPTHFILSNMFRDDLLSRFLKIGLYFSVFGMLLYGHCVEDALFHRCEFFVLVLFGTIGMMSVCSANNLLVLYIGLEVLSLALYVLVAMNTKEHIAVEAAIKYFVLGAVASGILLYGLSLVYGLMLSFDMSLLSSAVQSLPAENMSLLLVAVLFIVVGVAFKLGLAPFHFWVPDVYQGSHVVVLNLIGTASKIVAFALAFRLLVSSFHPLFKHCSELFTIFSGLSMVLGNTVAIMQNNIKRLLAYSAIAQMGFMVLGLIGAATQGHDQAVVGYSASLFFTIMYVLSASAVIGSLQLIRGSGKTIENIDDFKGLVQTCPTYAWMLLILFLSLAGIPPTVGFLMKLNVLRAIFESGGFFLAGVAVLSSVIGAFYYLRMIKIIFFDEPIHIFSISGQGVAVIFWKLSAFFVLFLGIYATRAMSLCMQAITQALL